MKTLPTCLALLLTVLILTGCGRAFPTSVKFGEDSAAEANYASPPMVDGVMGGERNMDGPSRFQSGGEVARSPSAAIAGQQDPLAAANIELDQRKIIYTANVSLVVDNFDGFEQRIRDIVQQHNGYLAQANLDRMQGESRRGRWQARIPVAQYDEFLKALSTLGVPTSQEQNAQDVTEEFVDLTARVENKRKLETRIIELLDRPDDKIQHVIEVERELARVREEIERMEGRIRFLSDQTAMTTVSISAHEERNYQPPQAPSLGSRISTAWSSSLENTSLFFQDAVVFFAGHILAIIAWLVGILAGWFVFRIVWRKLRGQVAGATSEY